MGLLDDLGNAVGDVANDIGNVIDGIGSAVRGLFGGPAAIIGLVFTAAATILTGPSYSIPIFVASQIATKALIKQRGLNAAEIAFARNIFGNTIPYDRIILTNVGGINGRKFTIPDGLGNILVNLANAYDNPLSATQGSSYPCGGQVFVHEMTHAWQIINSEYPAGFLCEALATQFRDQLGQDVYNQAGIRGTQALGKNWCDYNPEEEATIIDSWYEVTQTSPFSDWPAALFLPYLNDNIRPPNFYADYRPYLPPGQQAILITPANAYWQVTYSAIVWRYTFATDGTATYRGDDGSSTPPSSGGTRLSAQMLLHSGSAAGAQPSAASTFRATAPTTLTRISASVPAASFSAASALARSGSLSRLAGATVSPPPPPASALVTSPATSPSGGGVRGSSPLVTLGSLKGTGKWRYQSGKVAVTWDDATQELWDLPLSPTKQMGRSLSGEGTFTAKKVVPGAAPVIN
jgi:hypothetical protein